MKIVIAGAGIGGLCLAGLLADSKHDVIVYESAKNLDAMRYDWHDDVSPKAFEELNLPIPEGSFPKNSSYFVSPFNKGRIHIQQPAVGVDLSVERKPLNKMLYDRINPEKVVFNTSVTKALVSDNTVIGCEVVYSDGIKENIFCDLLIDCAGVNSSVRQSLPKSLRVPNKVLPNDLFFAYRAFFDKIGDAPLTEKDNKVYMKHLGEAGISWCFNNHDLNSLNVLVGRIGELSKDTLSKALEDLRADNPCLGNNVLRGGGVHIIPVRHPLDMFVASGYAAIGDSACMTIPMIGSGIASALYAAKILANVILNTNSNKLSDLWQYQYEVYKKFGASHCGVDYMKKWLLGLANDEINWLFTSGILSEEDLLNSSSGEMVALNAKTMIQKLLIGVRKLSLFKKLLGVVVATKKTAKIANSIPQIYSKEAVSKWQEDLEKCYRQP